MSRWDDEDELDRERDRLRGREPAHEPTLGETIDAAVRKIVTGIVIAGGVIALGLYASRGGDPSVDYQIATTPDGTLYRVDSEHGRLIACRNDHCWRLVSDSDDIDDDPPAGNAAAPAAVQAAPAAVSAQPAQAQLPAPQNQQAPAPAAR
jgi:hypothetical protein